MNCTLVDPWTNFEIVETPLDPVSCTQVDPRTNFEIVEIPLDPVSCTPLPLIYTDAA